MFNSSIFMNKNPPKPIENLNNEINLELVALTPVKIHMTMLNSAIF